MNRYRLLSNFRIGRKVQAKHDIQSIYVKKGQIFEIVDQKFYEHGGLMFVLAKGPLGQSSQRTKNLFPNEIQAIDNE